MMKKLFTKILALSLLFTMPLAACTNKHTEPEPIDPPVVEVEYNAAKVCEDFNANLEAAGYGALVAEWNEQYEEYSTVVSFGESDDESEETLASAAATLASFLPDYMEEPFEMYGDPTAEDYYDMFGDQSIYYYMDFDSPDEKSYAIVISYVYSGYLCAQLAIADSVE